MKKVKLIVACDLSSIIGHGLNMPGWHITDDLKLFSFLTRGGESPVKGNPIIIGHNTAKSLLKILGKPFPGRTTIVVTTEGDPELEESGFIVTKGISAFYDALSYAEKCPGEETWIGGGGRLYETALKAIVINEIYITKIQSTYKSLNGEKEINFCGFPADQYKIDLRKSKEFKKRCTSADGQSVDRGNTDNAIVEVYMREY